MPQTKSRRSFAIYGLIGAVLLAVGVGGGIFLIQKYPKEWQHWKETPIEIRWLMAELEVERFFHRWFAPSPQPERYSHVTAEVLDQAMRKGADWLLTMQENKGRYRYWYHPIKDQFSAPYDDNFLRQAGTSFAMIQVYEMSGDERYLESAQKSVRHLRRSTRLLDSDKAYFMFNGKAKLGGISLPMLTMLKIRQLTGTQKYDKLLKRLANMILFLQEKYGTGQYKSTYVYRWDRDKNGKPVDDYDYEKNSGWESKIYPGEAMLALAMMHEAFKDPRYKTSIDEALEFYQDEEQWQYHSFLSWTIAAFVSMYEQTSEQKYADYAFLLSDFLLTQQNLDPDDDVYGSFHALPSANTGTYLEGLGEGIYLAQLTKDETRLNRYQEHAKMGFRWLLQLQYNEDTAADLRNAKRALGGIRASLVDPQLRIDYTQHTVSAFVKGLRYIFHQKTISSELSQALPR